MKFEVNEIKSLEQLKRDYCLYVYDLNDKNCLKTAKILGVNRNTLHNIIYGTRKRKNKSIPLKDEVGHKREANEKFHPIRSTVLAKMESALPTNR